MEQNVLEKSAPKDTLVGALIGLVRAADGSSYGLTTEETDLLILEALAAGENADGDILRELLHRIESEKARLAPNCASCTASCGRTQNYDMQLLRWASAEVRDWKLRILFALQNLAVPAHRAMASGQSDRAENRVFYKALFAIGSDWGAERLQSVLTELETDGCRFNSL